ncbi:DNA repair protein RAD57 [Arthroderma uncinatum]|uniref:DNA repair protein RAD57 n=1 Tax=Arthroderma uncinatum TaxID=74035 RepID=UPI00144ACFBC|nr:DNA repair protein RAD57 [Arthroderma uncinatum]KAF3491933.1 DNA repair protein RAD57 [Arthroderma uncinatum]
MDLSLTLPDFPIKPYAHILPLLDKAGITIKELFLLDALEIAKCSRAPVTDIRNLTAHILEALRQDLGLGTEQEKDRNNEARPLQSRRDGNDHGNGNGNVNHESSRLLAESKASITLHPPSLGRISTLDPILDSALSGGISTGYVTEVTGESGSGKTQFLLHLLLSVQLPAPHGLSKNALYISTESDLATNRLNQLLNEHATLQALPPDTPRPSLDNIFTVTTVDLETQEHVINYQIPVAISRYNVGLIVIDSITANYRAESSTESVSGLLERSWQLKKLGHLLRTLAATHNIAMVVANQISDGFESTLHDSFVIPEGFRETPGSPLEHSSPSAAPSFAPASQPYQPQNDVGNKPKQNPLSHSPQLDQGYLDNDDMHTCTIPSFNTLLSLEYQQPFFTGWGEAPYSYGGGLFGPPRGYKLPALGLVWTNQIGCRIVLKSKGKYRSLGVNDLETSIGHNPNLNAQDDKLKIPKETLEAFDEEPKTVSNDTNNHSQQAHDHKVECNNNSEHTTTLPLLSSQESFATLGEENWSDYTSVPTSDYRGRRRQMQVVFSPWASGNPCQEENYGHGADGSLNEDNTIPKEIAFDSMYDAVEFEILPQGLRGLGSQCYHLS